MKCQSKGNRFLVPSFTHIQDPVSKLPADLLVRGSAVCDVVLKYCIDLICWEKTDELPGYLNVS